MRLLLIGNPVSGSGRGRKRMQVTESALRSLGATVTVFETTRPGSAAELLDVPPQDIDRVVACGGDGLVSEVAGALRGSELPMAVIPAGRGNDVARALGLPLDLAAAAEVALSGQESPMDCGTVNGEPFFTVAACGIDAEVSRRGRSSRLPLPGPGVYVVELFKALRTLPRFDARIEVEGRIIEADLMALAAANGPTYGGGFQIAPAASLRDGLLDVCLVRASTRLRALSFFPAVFRGTHGNLPEVESFRCEEMRVTTTPGMCVEADGEALSATPALYRAETGALRVITPGEHAPP